jgi:hypothetical protein
MTGPPIKVHAPDGEFVAACRYAEDAAAIVAARGPGSTIRMFARVLWTEGLDGHAADGYDNVAAHILGASTI